MALKCAAREVAASYAAQILQRSARNFLSSPMKNEQRGERLSQRERNRQS